MKISNELKRAVARAKAAIETRTKIKAAIDTAISLQPAAEARLQQAIETIGDAEVEAALSGESAAVPGGAYGAISDARMSVDVLAAKIQVLQRKLSAQEQEVKTAENDLETARNQFTEDCIAEYRVQLSKAAAEFSAVLKQGAALAEALNFGVMEMAIRSIAIADPTDAGTKVLDMDVRALRGGSAWTSVSIWQGDTAAEAVYKSHSEPYSVAKALKAVQ